MSARHRQQEPRPARHRTVAEAGGPHTQMRLRPPTRWRWSRILGLLAAGAGLALVVDLLTPDGPAIPEALAGSGAASSVVALAAPGQATAASDASAEPPDCAPSDLDGDFLVQTGTLGAGALGASGLGCLGSVVDALPPTTLERTEPELLYQLITREDPIEPLRYAPEDLVTVQGGPYQLREEAAEQLERLLAAGEEAGHRWLVVTSGYRAYDVQAGTHQDWVGRVGAERAAKVSALPGHSEHQLGLAVDVGGECGLYECFGYADDGTWVAENAHRWGFIIRYPEGGEKVTGYAWEPWHLRYVGPRAAWAMKLSGEVYWERAQPRLVD